jgi:hypothetical protein
MNKRTIRALILATLGVYHDELTTTSKQATWRQKEVPRLESMTGQGGKLFLRIHIASCW